MPNESPTTAMYQTPGAIFGRVVLYSILIIAAIYFLIPLVVMIITSLKTMNDIRTGHYPHFRMVLTAKGTLSAQHERSCAAHVAGFPVGEWHTVRYRFVEGCVIGEAQRDDGSWRPLQVMLVPSPPTSVIIGKAADLNRDVDLGGEMREFWVDDVQIRTPRPGP